MSTKEKLIERFLKCPKDFTFDDTVRLFAAFGYALSHKGATSGSRVAFVKEDKVFDMHRPHPDNVMKQKTLRNVFTFLKEKEKLPWVI